MNSWQHSGSDFRPSGSKFSPYWMPQMDETWRNQWIKLQWLNLKTGYPIPMDDHHVLGRLGVSPTSMFIYFQTNPNVRPSVFRNSVGLIHFLGYQRAAWRPYKEAKCQGWWHRHNICFGWDRPHVFPQHSATMTSQQPDLWPSFGAPDLSFARAARVSSAL